MVRGNKKWQVKRKTRTGGSRQEVDELVDLAAVAHALSRRRRGCLGLFRRRRRQVEASRLLLRRLGHLSQRRRTVHPETTR